MTSILPSSTSSPLSDPGLIITCEHASHALPSDGPVLGVTEQQLLSHVSWDPGAAPVAQLLSTLLSADLEMGRYSRLLVDLNRSPTNPQVVPAVSFGTPVPGNADLTPEQIKERIAKYHQGYWDCVGDRIRNVIHRTGRCLHLSIHSFTPDLDSVNRRFDVGLLFDPDRQIDTAVAVDLHATLVEHGYSVQYNKPYTGTQDGVTVAHRRILPADQYIGLEIELNHAMMVGDWVMPVVAAFAEALGRDTATVQVPPAHIQETLLRRREVDSVVPAASRSSVPPPMKP